MPLVQGLSQIKWHLPHSIHGEHRGRTGKCPIANHRVEYNYGKVIPVRIAIDKANNLSECIVEFEVLQEFPSAGVGSREERITLGKLTLNLSEYVEESEAVMRDTGYRPRGPSFAAATTAKNNNNNIAPPSASQGHTRKRSSLSATASLATSDGGNDNSGSNNDNNNKAPSINEPPETYVEDGIIRRYLMTDSKINSTLKLSILMIQIDGERHYVAPPLKSAPVFGGIAGMTSSSHPHDPTGEFGQHFLDDPQQNTPSRDDVTAASTSGASSNGKLRDVYELQDMYRRALAASWACQPGELPADQCIEDIFAGGDGFGPDGLLDGAGGSVGGDVTPRGHHHHHHHRRHGHSVSAVRAKVQREDSGSSTNGGAGGGSGGADDFLRPPERRTPTPSGTGRRNHFRQNSGESGASMMRIDVGTARGGDPYLHHPPHQQHPFPHRPGHRRDSSKDSSGVSLRDSGMRSRSESLVSLAATIESERGRSGFKNAREVTESEVRDDLVAWKLPGTIA